jgi:hypothetical protein
MEAVFHSRTVAQSRLRPVVAASATTILAPGRVAVAVGASRELVGDLWLLCAGLADDGSAVPDEVRTRASLDGVEGQLRLSIWGVLGHPLPQVFDGRSSIGVDQAKGPGISFGPKLSVRLSIRRIPRRR